METTPKIPEGDFFSSCSEEPEIEELKREVYDLRKKDQENLKKIKELEEKNTALSNETNLWRTILPILQDTANKICQSHSLITIKAAVEGFLVTLENHGKIFVPCVVPKPYQEVALQIVNGVVSVIRGVTEIKGFFQYLLEWVQDRPAIKNE